MSMKYLKLFDRVPTVFPTAFEETFLSGNLFAEFDKVFNSQKLRQMSVYPTDIYNLLEGEEVTATIIEIACAGITRNKCKVELNENKLIVDIGIECAEDDNVNEPVEKATKKSKKTEPVTEETVNVKIEKQYIQKQIAERQAHMQWTISNKIDKKNIDVKYEDGVLKITCPWQKKDPEDSKIFEIN